MPLRVEILLIGNELLEGDVRDRNGWWLARTLTGLGARVERICTVRDEVEAIAVEVRGSLARGADWLFTAGGLGPTADDRTLEGVARALNRPLREDPEARAWLEDRYRRLAAEGKVKDPGLLPPRRKMARLPEGGQPLANPVGTAPGVLLRIDRTTVVCLPGVPEELEGIFRTSLAPYLREGFGNAGFALRRLRVHHGDESTLAPLLETVARRRPQVYVKSRARAFGRGIRLRVYLSARAATAQEAEAQVAAAASDLERTLAAAGIAVEREAEAGEGGNL